MLLLFHRIKCDKSYIYDNHVTKQIWTAEFRAVVRLHLGSQLIALGRQIAPEMLILPSG